jgi:actin-like ATPase involved in cell morphogenesis
MSYFLGIDLGTTYTAAALCRDGKAEIARLGSRTPAIPSVVCVRADGSVLTGDAAERRAVTEPERIAREFKRRLGDPTPIIVGGTPWSADALSAKLLGAVVAKVTETEGRGPDGIVIAHPANWGEYKQDLLTQAVRQADLGDVTFITEPEAAAIHYATQERVKRGTVVAVYDLGGGTFDAAVLRRTEFGWQILGTPEGVEHLGGVDFDEAVFTHVAESIGDDFDLLDPDDPAVLSAVARLRQECVDGKEALAADTDVTIPVLLPSASTPHEVRLTRSEFEDMIRPAIADSITALERALRSAGVTADDVTSVLLVGGSSRIPLVAEMVGSVLGRPVAVDAHPKHAVALGAAIVADERGALAALTAAGEAATAAAASVAALAAVRGSSDIGPSGPSPRVAAGSTGTLAMGLGSGLGAGAGTSSGAGAAVGPGADDPDITALASGDETRAGTGGVAVAPAGDTGTVVSGTAAATRVSNGGPAVPAGDRTTPRDLPTVTPEVGSVFPVPATGAYYRPGERTGPGGPGGAPRRTSSGSHRIAARRRSQVRGAIVLGSLCVMIVSLAAILFAYNNRGHNGSEVFDAPATTQPPAGEVTTTATTTPDDDGNNGDRPPSGGSSTTSPSSTTTPSTTTVPNRSTIPSTTAPTTTPTTTTPATTEPPTTEPPTTEPPTTPTTTPPTSIDLPIN